MTGFLSVLLAVLVLPLGGPAPAFPDAPPQAWLVVEEGGRLLRLGDRPVRFEGTGHLVFGEDRTRVRVEGAGPLRVFVDGEPARGRQALVAAATIELRTADGARWRLRPVRAEALAPSREGTRIADARPEGEARVDATEPTRFIVRVDRDGGSLFFYPD
ncbi:MAG: hypothetical protein R3362_08370 [Rhodothermales bacterium]|nr:hypothetical protein [Rhodothermales bacterium]